MQFSHAPSDRDMADQYWAGKTDGAYAFRSLLDSGAVVVNGSDAPIEELDPLAGIRAGVRRSIDERPAWHPEQALTIDQAFHATCVAPAWLARDERRRGRLLPGHAADLVVLDRDPWRTSTRRSSRRWSPAAGCTTRRPGTNRTANLIRQRRPRFEPFGFANALRGLNRPLLLAGDLQFVNPNPHRPRGNEP